jgi:CheY-like chemotaxis protein
MPKMNGHEFIEKINNMEIEIPLIITEGSLLSPHEYPKSKNIVSSIKKPFLPQELCKLIESVRYK